MFILDKTSISISPPLTPIPSHLIPSFPPPDPEPPAPHPPILAQGVRGGIKPDISSSSSFISFFPEQKPLSMAFMTTNADNGNNVTAVNKTSGNTWIKHLTFSLFRDIFYLLFKSARLLTSTPCDVFSIALQCKLCHILYR